jgi:hypothetical protein
MQIKVTYGKGFEPKQQPLATFANMGVATLEVTKEKIVKLQDELLKMKQADIVTEHTFAPGVYERKITIPPWTVLTGAAHKTAYKIRLEKGTIAVNVGTEVKVLTAPLEFNASAGEQRVGRVFDEEVVWVDVYENLDDCTDIPTLEDRLYVVPEYGLGDSRTTVQQAKLDYKLFLNQINMTYEQVQAIAENESDLIPMPDGYFVQLQDSPIHGQGLFATKPFKIGEIVCPGRLNGKRTPGGRFINHSFNANIEPLKDGDDIYSVAIKNIDVGDELLLDYRASMRVNFGLMLQGELT